MKITLRHAASIDDKFEPRSLSVKRRLYERSSSRFDSHCHCVAVQPDGVGRVRSRTGSSRVFHRCGFQGILCRQGHWRVPQFGCDRSAQRLDLVGSLGKQCPGRDLQGQRIPRGLHPSGHQCELCQRQPRGKRSSLLSEGSARRHNRMYAGKQPGGVFRERRFPGSLRRQGIWRLRQFGRDRLAQQFDIVGSSGKQCRNRRLQGQRVSRKLHPSR